MYDPRIGRWISQDPIGFEAGDANLYRYANNNPLLFADPSGFASTWVNPKQSPGWVKRMIGRPDPYNPNSGVTVDSVREVRYDRNHAGGAHYDVTYETSNGSAKTRRFWRDGNALTQAENRALSQGRRPRRGTLNARTALSIGLTSIIVGTVEIVYDHYVQTGAQGAIRLGTSTFSCRYIRAMLHAGELPEVYDNGTVRSRFFKMNLQGGTYRVILDYLPGGGVGIHVVKDGFIFVRGCNCPLAGG